MEFIQGETIAEENKAKKQKMCVEENSESMWWSIPEPVLQKILALLEPKDILNASSTCRRWYEVANDKILWKHLFQQRFRTDPSIPLRPGE